jgi:hypothetical protein
MTTANQGRRKVEEYLTGNLSLFALNNWSLEFGDDPADADDHESMEFAGLITELIDDLGTGTIEEHALRDRLIDELKRPFISSDGSFERRAS